MGDGILLATINAKWIHPSLALRLLKANLGGLEKRCAIIEFALRQPLHEKTDPILAARPRILGLSVSIWNHTATLELLKELQKAWEMGHERPVVVLGGPEVSYLPKGAEIFGYADYCITGEGEFAFHALCKAIFNDGNANSTLSSVNFAQFQGKKIISLQGEKFSTDKTAIVQANPVDVSRIQTAYHLYTDEDLGKKLVYAETSRGCPFGCEFCLSAITQDRFLRPEVREFPLDPFFAEMDDLIDRGARSIKFLDRTFNHNIERAMRIMGYFLEKIVSQKAPLVVHFEMFPSRFPPELLEVIARFPPGTLRLEIGIQTLNRDVSANIGRPSNPEKELATLRHLREKTNAILHVDLIAGLPGEDMDSFGRGFNLLWTCLQEEAPLVLQSENGSVKRHPRAEIQLGILKLLPGAPIARHTAAFGMRYNPSPPYELMESASISAPDLDRIKNFARFWELIVNRGLLDGGTSPVFGRFMALSASLLARFGRNWGIDKNELLDAINSPILS